MKLFDYIRVLFGKDSDWAKLTNYDKSKNSFMTNRFMCIKFPIQANLFNTLKTDPIGQAEAWRMIGSKFNKVPGFIFTKIKKNEIKEKEWNPNPKIIDVYLKINEIGIREFKEALKYDYLKVKTAIDILEKQMSDDVN